MTADTGLRRIAVDLRACSADMRADWLADIGRREPETIKLIAHASHVEFGTKYGIWAEDPVGFTTTICKEALSTRQREIMWSVNDNPRTAVPSCFSSGKCAWEHDEIALAEGRVVTFGSLVGQRFDLHTWGADGRTRCRRARAEWNAVEPVYRVTTSSGRTVVRNAAHPLMAARHVPARLNRHRTPDGWKYRADVRDVGWRPVGGLAVGDLVLVPEAHPSEGKDSRPFDELAFAGYLLGDGGATQQLTFTQQDGPVLDEFRGIVDRLGCRMVKLHRPYDWTVRGTDIGRTNPALRLAEAAGVRGCEAKDKRLPSWAWTLPNTDLAILVSRLFACDAWAHSRVTAQGARYGEVGIALASEGLVRDVERAMLRLGVPGRVRHRRTSAGGKVFDAWEWLCRDAPDLLTLSKVLDVPGKQDAIAAAVALTATRTGARGVRDWIHLNAPVGYRWDAVRNVERLPGFHRTVAVEVDGEHTFVTSMVEHNTHALARLQAWWVCVHPVGTAICVTTASRMRQVITQLWPHTRRLHAAARLPGKVDTYQWSMVGSSGKPELVSYGFTPPHGDPEAVQGVHAPHVLVLGDEAGMLNPITGQAWLSATTGSHTRIVFTGNPPVDEEGSWLESISTSPEWNVVPLPAAATPNFTGEDVGRCRSCADWRTREHRVNEHLISHADVDLFAKDFGVDSPFYLSKVKALFVKGAANKAVPAAWVSVAVPDRAALPLSSTETERLQGRAPQIVLGVDTAQGGADELVVARREGRIGRLVRHQRGEANRGSFDVAGYVKLDIDDAQQLRSDLAARHPDETQKPIVVLVDATGDRGPVDTLAAWNSEGLLGGEVTVVGVNFGSAAEDSARFQNRRAEMWWGLREAVQPDESHEARAVMLVDNVTTAQMSDPKHATSHNGRIQIESKDDLRSRGRPSPDRADAMALAWYWPDSLIPRKRRGILAGA